MKFTSPLLIQNVAQLMVELKYNFLLKSIKKLQLALRTSRLDFNKKERNYSQTPAKLNNNLLVKLHVLAYSIMKMMPGPAAKDTMKMEAFSLLYHKSITLILIT
jgi:hypothetical protein